MPGVFSRLGATPPTLPSAPTTTTTTTATATLGAGVQQGTPVSAPPHSYQIAMPTTTLTTPDKSLPATLQAMQPATPLPTHGLLASVLEPKVLSPNHLLSLVRRYCFCQTKLGNN